MKTGFGDIHAKIDELCRKIITSSYYTDFDEPIVVKEPATAWEFVSDNSALHGTYIRSDLKGSYVFFSFFGTGISIRFRVGNFGVAKIIIDNKFVYEFDCYSSSEGWYDYALHNISNENAYHSCKIVVTGRKNPSSTSPAIGVDYYFIEVKAGAVSITSGQNVTTLTDIQSISGVALSGRDWSADFSHLGNLDVLLSTRASESTLSAISSNIDVSLSTRASESTLSSFKSQAYDVSLDLYKVYEIPQPVVNDLIHNSATVNSAGSSSLYSIGGAKRVDVLIYVSSVVGTPSAEFFVDVIESASSQVIKSYSSGTISSVGSYYIGIDGQANVLGDTIRVSWTGVDGSNYLDGVYTRLVVKP